MNERGTAVLEKYDFKVIRTTRVRGAILCDTNHGLKVLKEYKGTQSRLEFEEELLRKIMDKGIINVDQITPNNQGSLWSTDHDGTKYIVKNWYAGRNPDVGSINDIEESAAILGRLHKVMNSIELENKIYAKPNEITLSEEYRKHTIEIKRARNFIKCKRRKLEFELRVLDCFDQFYQNAMDAMARLNMSVYPQLIRTACDRGTLCHGNYNYHNICLSYEKMGVMNFDKAKVDLQIKDLYNFLRKSMEKNNWSIEMGGKIIEAYNRQRSISPEEMEVLHIMLCYPEKFWKIINYYFNSNKAWISEKNMEKLDTICNQRQLKENFTLFLNQYIVQ